MSNLTRRDFLKGSAALGVGFVSVGGILVPRNSEAASPLVGIILTSLLQVITAYLAHRSQYRLNSFNEQYQPFDKMASYHTNLGHLVGNVAQNTLHSERANAPINRFTHNEEGMQFQLRGGQLYMGREGNFVKTDPSESDIIKLHYHKTGEYIIPTENTQNAYYNIPTKYQRDEVKERIKDFPEFKNLELGEGLNLQGTRKAEQTTSGKMGYMAKVMATNNNDKQRVQTIYMAG